MPITFRDEKAVCWTVASHSSPRSDEPGHTTLVFTSEGGEQRTCDGWLPPNGVWEDVEERAWRALLRHAEAMPPTARPD
jgi:hypothetical protein